MTEAALTIDSDFCGLTPLNTPDKQIIADVVAVTGPAGHAFGSWKSRETHRMWLKDFLPRDIKGIRIMSYGYNTGLLGYTVDGQFLDYGGHFIHMLKNSRSSAEERSRPIIFIGHSMGSILILQALLQSKYGGEYKQLFDSTRAIYFFGTPHQRLEINELLPMIDDVHGQSSRSGFVKQLQEGADFLDTHRDDIMALWDQTSGVEIVSFYETRMTAVVKKSPFNWGDGVIMAKSNRAQLFWPSEHRIPVQRNHTDMVIFNSGEDATYRTVVTHMTECVNNLATFHANKLKQELYDYSSDEFCEPPQQLYCSKQPTFGN